MFGYVMQHYWYKYNENDANDNTMNEPLEGVYSAFLNKVTKLLRNKL